MGIMMCRDPNRIYFGLLRPILIFYELKVVNKGINREIFKICLKVAVLFSNFNLKCSFLNLCSYLINRTIEVVLDSLILFILILMTFTYILY